MRILFYKLPSESGENVIVTEGYAFVESELAIQLDEADLALPYYDLYANGDERSVTFVEDDPETVEPYLVIDTSLNVDATLPFKDDVTAARFLETIIKWQAYLNKAYDE